MLFRRVVLAEELGRWTRSSARKELDLEDEVVLLLLGTVCARKGQLDLVKAVSAIPLSSRSKIRIYIVGAFMEPKYVSKIKRELARIPADMRGRIILTGAVPDTTLYYSASDIFVCCSRLESAPRVSWKLWPSNCRLSVPPHFWYPGARAGGP